ncbi:hypothetical protein ACFQZV_09765 [Microbacterium koreense]|uniref:PH domain-containing protein n=1 Tax=Microbacterium koreense TaxID=323761 RepID=A0ABW2ZTK3_9MICO
MTREAAVLVMVGVAVLILGLAAWGWWRRTRRDSGLTAPVGELPERARIRADVAGLYVATTAHGQPLERLAVRGLAFRSRADLVVSEAGLALDLTGKPRVVIARDRIIEVAQATVAIDRVVEKDGLVRLTWRVDDTTVDSYFRPQDRSSRSLTELISSTITPIQTGTDV